MTDATGGCPFHTLPTDGTPLTPSRSFDEWRQEGAAVPLRYADGHEGWLVTRHEMARAVLEDPRFSMQPHRFPVGPPEGYTPNVDHAAARSMGEGSLLSLDPPQHARVRRSVTSRFSVRSVRGYQDAVRGIVARQLEHLLAQGSPANLTEHYAERISALVHCLVLGIPATHIDRFVALFVGESGTQQKFEFLREVLALKREDPGEDVLSDLLRSDLDETEIEGATHMLMVSGRDSVAYLIATATVALLTHPEQLRALRDDPDLIGSAIEEFMRFGAMFVTLFPRTATEDVTISGVSIRAGQTVSVSPVAANRDERRFEHPEVFDIQRDAFGHLGFGHGQHGCVGQQLARLQIREAITQLLVGIPTLSLVEAEQTAPMPFAHDVATYEAGAVIVAW